MSPHLLRAEMAPAPPGQEDRFPFSIPALRDLGVVGLDRSLTFLVGENGSGKSTLLEALAVASGLPTVGSARAAEDDSLRAQARLAHGLRLVWRKRTHRGFFLRAEDFFGFIRVLRAQRAELEAGMAAVRRDMAEAPEHSRNLALGPYRASLTDMDFRYGEDPDARSHGESFLDLFRGRFVPGGLYLLDEPEAALSPRSQLAFLAMVADMIEQGGQFVVATHSPLLLAAPGAGILGFDTAPAAPVGWEDLESVRLYREFLEAPDRYLRHIWRG